MIEFLAHNWLRIAAALILLALLAWILVQDYRFRHGDSGLPHITGYDDPENWLP